MEKDEIFKSDGGYRIVWGLWGENPILKNCPWFETKEEAEMALLNKIKEREKQEAIDKALIGDFSALEKIDIKMAENIKNTIG